LSAKTNLIQRVWPNTVVEETNLKVHIAALRRALGDGRDGNRYIVNIPGRGYRFVAAVSSPEALVTASATGTAARSRGLPASLTRERATDGMITQQYGLRSAKDFYAFEIKSCWIRE
jgi:DNA-binding winged helix-turn-helix (wHTH) protein